MKNYKKILACLLAAVMSMATMASCTGSGGGDAGRKHLVRELAEKPVYDFTEERALPGPEEGVDKTVKYIDLNGASYQDLFMTVSLQGNVNRHKASLYVIHAPLIEPGSIGDASKYWFEKLPETYTGDEAFEYEEYTDPYQLLVDNASAVKGAVLYHERLVDAANTVRGGYAERYADIAVLNLTIMMCGQYEAVALTYEQYNKLSDRYGVTLPILGDTHEFMAKDEEGEISEDRSSREVWARVYRYALAKFGDSVSRKALVHNPGNQAGCFDYAIANKLFVYNRIYRNPTEYERNMEYAILDVTDANTPVLGVWYLQEDELSYVPFITQNYKYMIVSYESFDWSWTTGLPAETFDKVEEEKITLDPDKNYVAFTFSEGDNNSYVQTQLPAMYESADRGSVPVGWAMAPTVLEINPNIVRYLNDNWAAGDGIAAAEAGIGYVSVTPPEESRGEFFALSDEYIGRMGTGAVRILSDDMAMALPYAELENTRLVTPGYGVTDFDAVNNDNEDSFLFRDTVFVKNLYGNSAADYLRAVEGNGPFFYSISLLGWGMNPTTAKNILADLGDNFVAVTPNQLADLYKQYYASQFEDITSASFASGMTREEMGFLYRASDYTAIEEGTKRYLVGKDYAVYDFDIDESAKEVSIETRISGNYQIEISNDDLNWYVVGSGSSVEPVSVAFEAEDVYVPGKPLYLRVGTRDLRSGDTAELYNVALHTDKAATGIIATNAATDHNVWVEGGEKTEDGRKGEFVYRFGAENGATSGELTFMSSGNVTAEISKDKNAWETLDTVRSGNLYAATLNNIGGEFYVKFNAESEVKAVKFTPEQAPVKQISFSPVTSKLTERYLVSVDSATETYGVNSARRISGDDNMLVKFRMAEGVTSAKLRLNIFGMYKVEISTDGKEYTTLKAVQPGETTADYMEADIGEFAKPGATVYVRISLSDKLGGSAFVRVAKVRVITNLSDDWLIKKVDGDRVYDARVKVATITPNGSDYGEDDTSSAEYKLIDEMVNCTIYMRNKSSLSAYRMVQEGGYIIYKFDLNSDEFWQIIGMEKPAAEITRLRLRINAMNGFRFEISSDKADWREGADAGDPAAQNGANEKYYDVEFTPEMVETGVVYLKYLPSSVFVQGKTHDGMMNEIQFFFN